MNYVEFMPAFQQVLRRNLATDRSAEHTLVAVLRACAEAVPDPRWRVLEVVRWDAELDAFAAWLSREIEAEPPHDSIEHWSLCVPDLEDNPAELTVLAHPKYDHRKGSPWSDGIQWPADKDAQILFDSTVLAAAAGIIGVAPSVRSRFEADDSWTDYVDEAMPLLYAVPPLYAAVLARHAARAIGHRRLSPPGLAARVTVTFSGGEDIEIGSFGPDGVWRAPAIS